MDLDQVRDLRASRPEAIAESAQRRVRRPLLTSSGRLMVVAADHPARGALGVRDQRGVMGDRNELLRRVGTALSRPGVDGVLGSPDIIEDLLLMGALENKIAIGSMNRGGLQGAVFELDDRFTGYDARTIAAMGLDGGKMLCRIDLQDPNTVANSLSRVPGQSASSPRTASSPCWSRSCPRGSTDECATTSPPMRSSCPSQLRAAWGRPAATPG